MNIKKYFKELKIKKYEIKFRHVKYTERGLEPEIKISPKIYFYDKDNFNCLRISEMHVTKTKKIIKDGVYEGTSELSRPFKDYFTNVEEKKINKIFEELIKDFKLYTKRCVAFNCNYNNEFDLKRKKYLKQNKTKIIKIDDKPKQINVLDSSTVILKDDKPKPFNLLDLDNDILNIIGDFVKKDNEEREEEIVNSEQTINGKIIMFRNFCCSNITKPLNTKENIKEYIYDYIDREFPDIKTYASNHRIKLSKDDKRRCAWVLFRRCKRIFVRNKLYHNKVIYNMDDDEEKDIFEEYLKVNKLNSPQKFEY